MNFDLSKLYQGIKSINVIENIDMRALMSRIDSDIELFLCVFPIVKYLMSNSIKGEVTKTYDALLEPPGAGPFLPIRVYTVDSGNKELMFATRRTPEVHSLEATVGDYIEARVPVYEAATKVGKTDTNGNKIHDNEYCLGIIEQVGLIRERSNRVSSHPMKRHF